MHSKIGSSSLHKTQIYIYIYIKAILPINPKINQLLKDFDLYQKIIDNSSKLHKMDVYQLRSLINALAGIIQIIRELLVEDMMEMRKVSEKSRKVQEVERKLEVMEGELRGLMEKVSEGGVRKQIMFEQASLSKELVDDSIELDQVIIRVEDTNKEISDLRYRQMIRVLASRQKQKEKKFRQNQEMFKRKIEQLQDQIITQNHLILLALQKKQISEQDKERLLVTMKRSSKEKKELVFVDPAIWISPNMSLEVRQKQLIFEGYTIKGVTENSAIYGPVMIWNQKISFQLKITKGQPSIGLALNKLSLFGLEIKPNSKTEQMVELTCNGYCFNGIDTTHEGECFREGDVVKVVIDPSDEVPRISWMKEENVVYSCNMKVRFHKMEWVPYIHLGKGGQVQIISS